ncbi:IS5/IS1182 family transposase [Burkholderia sp. HI2714]|uniref:IS5 family transposase n=1 Tax=Burkholderia sp. HI2714 TaxID=2015359 RepID=UPI000B7A2E26|nr:IS5 family transposase [Burkholderia sp. HI2714]OXJ22498.1 IS5/IS1182 family transposase [Burkholderia sp. HI2714]
MIKVSLFAEQERESKLDKIGDALSKLGEHVDFAALAEGVDEAAPRPGRERGGRPPFPTELMVRVLVVQQLYNLSDEQMEFQLLDRLSFQRFVGLRQSSQAPDRTTIWTFKERLIRAGASERIFEAVNRQLDCHGYIARGGQMIDASIVPVPKQTLTKDEKGMVQQDAMPAEWSPSKRRQKDVQARWTKKHGKSYFGYKLSGSVDRRHKLIRRVHVSTASEHDTLHFERVLDAGNTSRDVWADKGYVDSEREQRLGKTGWRLHIQREGRPGKPLSECQARRNRRIAKPRARVEHVFAALEQMGGKVLRSIGLARATLHLNWKAAAYNLRRLCSLMEVGPRPF